jgi:hypothetical protein
MLYATVDALRTPQKAINCSGVKNGKSSKEIRLSRYQSIDIKHFWVYVKFEVGLSILFTRKMSSKKVRLFPRSVPSSNGGIWKLKNQKFLRMWTFDVHFIYRFAYFSEPRWTTHCQISQATRCNAYLLNDTQKQAFWCFMRPWTLREAPKSDQLEWYQKWQAIQGNQAFLISVDR